jgi:hypothetical protein
VGSFEVPGCSSNSRILPRLSLEEAVLDSSDAENPDSEELPLHQMTLNQLEEWVTNIMRAQVAEKRYQYILAVLWIRVGCIAVSDLDFYLSVDPDPGSQTNADQCIRIWILVILKSLHEKYRVLKIGHGQKTYLRRYNSLLKARKPGLFVR